MAFTNLGLKTSDYPRSTRPLEEIYRDMVEVRRRINDLSTDLKVSSGTVADPTAYVVSNPPTQAEVQAILSTLQGIYNLLNR